MTDDLVRPTIPIAYLADMTTGARAGAIRKALGAASLPKRALSSRRMRVSITQFERFYTTLVRARDDELFGFLARPVPRGAYAMLVRLLTGSEDLGSALDAAARFYRLFDGRPVFELTVDRTTTTLSLDPRHRAKSVFFVHAFLLSASRTGDWLVGRTVPLDAVVLPRELARFRSEARHLFGREPTFASGAPRIVFRTAHAKLPVVRRPDEADAYVARSLRDLLVVPPRASTETNLRAILAAGSDLPFDEAARRLGFSRASLARELARLGTSFLRVKDDLRRDHAIALLTETRLGLDEIGVRLGYSGARAFQRAFRQWTGTTAGTFRVGSRSRT
jgi:AraC-like DNA-binding protein